MKLSLLLSLLLPLPLGACADGGTDAMESTGLDDDSPGADEDEDVVGCSGSPTYTVSFTATWSAATHPSDFPVNPHFSGLIGAAHDGSFSIWEPGELSSPGIQSMAETGSKTALQEEMQAAISGGADALVLSGGGIGVSPGAVALSFAVSPTRDRVCLVSMVAPSPDWFVGVHGLPLCIDGEWITEVSHELFAYDAGTDSGLTYTAANAESAPRELISEIDVTPFLVEAEVPAVGTMLFSLQE